MTNRGQAEDGERQEVEFDHPAPAISTKAGGQWKLRTGANSMVTGRKAEDVQPYERDIDRPAPVVDTKALAAWTTNRPATTWELAVLQDFPADFPWRGNKTQIAQQIGNAIPVGLASAVLRQVV